MDALRTAGGPVTILQSGRLGDLWYVTPLANALDAAGLEVRVVFNESFGNPFAFFPSITPCPVPATPLRGRWRDALADATWQIDQWRLLRAQGGPVIWNQIFPLRWIQALAQGRCYPEYWYRNFPGCDFRRTLSTLTVSREPRILFFRRSHSFRALDSPALSAWLRANVRRLAEATGFEVVVVATAAEADDPEFPTWRGSLDEYQQLIARCSVVTGIVTSGHVLGQLLGKAVVAMYPQTVRSIDRIGGETIAITHPEDLTAKKITERLASGGSA